MGKSYYRCPTCGKRSDSEAVIMQHMKTVHGAKRPLPDTKRK